MELTLEESEVMNKWLEQLESSTLKAEEVYVEIIDKSNHIIKQVKQRKLKEAKSNMD